jgi:hypothetical protein
VGQGLVLGALCDQRLLILVRWPAGQSVPHPPVNCPTSTQHAAMPAAHLVAGSSQPGWWPGKRSAPPGRLGGTACSSREEGKAGRLVGWLEQRRGRGWQSRPRARQATEQSRWRASQQGSDRSAAIDGPAGQQAAASTPLTSWLLAPLPLDMAASVHLPQPARCRPRCRRRCPPNGPLLRLLQPPGPRGCVPGKHKSSSAGWRMFPGLQWASAWEGAGNQRGKDASQYAALAEMRS